jgi:TrmH family RNA methyltransferase
MADIASYFRLIQSPQNEVVKHIKIHLEGGSKSAKLRKESGQVCIEGIHLVDAWVRSIRLNEIKTIITSIGDIHHPEILATLQYLIEQCQDHDLEFPDLIMVEDQMKSSMSGVVNGPCLIALIEIPRSVIRLDEQIDTVVLDAIQDSGNVGTIMRTALAAGYKRILCTVGTASIWSSKVLRAAMGAHLSLEIEEMIEPKTLIEQTSHHIYATALDESAKNLYHLGDALLETHTFVFGNEGQGVSPIFLERSTKIFIPQEASVESLNVSAAAAICLFEARRIRQRIN